MATKSNSSPVYQVLLFVFRALFTIFAVMTTIFIFQNSLEIGAISSARSEAFTALVNSYLSPMGFPALTNAVVRKMAHFAEYAMLGFWFTLCLRVYTTRYIRHISWPLFLVLGIANVDETLQLYVANRSGSVRDVWIDFFGGCSGILLGLLLVMLLGGFWYLLGFGRHKRA